MPDMLPIIAQTDDFVVLHKPAGLSFHSEDGPGVVVLAEQQLGYKLFPVHRLDKVTSGLLLLARHRASAAELTRLFSERKVQKFYLALSPHKPQKKQGWVKGDMQLARRGAWRLTTTTDAPAITYFISQGYQQLPFRAFLLRPYTGKTHQLRVALKSQSAPIAGDTLYGAEVADRVYLHAYALVFKYLDTDYYFTQLPETGSLFDALLAVGLPEQWNTPWLYPWPPAPTLSSSASSQ